MDRQAGLDGHEQALRCLNMDMGYRVLPGSGEGRGQKGDGIYSGGGSQEVVSWGRLELIDWGTPLRGRQGWGLPFTITLNPPEHPFWRGGLLQGYRPWPSLGADKTGAYGLVKLWFSAAGPS